MKKAVLTSGLLTACLLAVGFAQQPAPEQASVDLYEKTIMVSYLPMKNGQVPLKKAWPVGGAAPATLHTDGDLIFKGLVVPKGDYSLYLSADADPPTVLVEGWAESQQGSSTESLARNMRKHERRGLYPTLPKSHGFVGPT